MTSRRGISTRRTGLGKRDRLVLDAMHADIRCRQQSASPYGQSWGNSRFVPLHESEIDLSRKRGDATSRAWNRAKKAGLTTFTREFWSRYSNGLKERIPFRQIGTLDSYNDLAVDRFHQPLNNRQKTWWDESAFYNR